MNPPCQWEGAEFTGYVAFWLLWTCERIVHKGD